jgi:hypothetical protein
MGTTSTFSGRRVIRRHTRPTLDQVWATVLADFDPALHEPIRRYAETQAAAFAARSALSTLLTQSGLRWIAVDSAVRELAY